MSIRFLLASSGGIDKRRAIKPLAIAASLPLLAGLTGCVGTPWGETLSGSFPAAPEPRLQVPEPAPSPDRSVAEKPRNASPPSSPGASPGLVPAPATEAPPPPVASRQGAPSGSPSASGVKGPQPLTSKPPAPQAKARPTAPSPYRVTLRLPQADPSAPAEAVTEALRSAGIPFEVETIERVKGAPAPQPELSPAPTTTVRPAPPPR